MQDMITAEMSDAASSLEPPAVLTAGLRAMWLNATLTSPAADALSPREREVLTVVAIGADGASARRCSVQLRRLGVGEEAAGRVQAALVQAGWLAYRIGAGGEQVLDLPAEDRTWIAEQVRSLSES